MKAEYGSDAVVDLLRSLGIDYVSINPGASTRGIHDSIVNHSGNNKPELVLCCHEGIAVSLAAGYFRATRKPMGVLLHDLEGLSNATRSIFDAWLGRDSIIMLGGNGPIDITKRRPGIDWIHSVLIPNLLVRDMVKWDDQPQGLQSVLESVLKAYRISMTEPTGPVFVSLDVSEQEKELAEGTFKLPAPADFQSTTFGEGSLDAIESVSELMIDSENPIILADLYGRGDESIQHLVRLAETVGAGVIDTGQAFNFPSSHPLNVSYNRELLERADLIVCLDTRDLYEALTDMKGKDARTVRFLPRSDCKIIRVDLEDQTGNSWVPIQGRLTPTHLSVAAHAPSFVAKLSEICAAKLVHSSRGRISERISALTEVHNRTRANALAEANRGKTGSVINPSTLALICWEAAKKYDWVIAHPGYTPQGITYWLPAIWDITRYNQYAGRSGGTGTGIGRAMGVGLANRGRLCIDFQPDGDLLYLPSSLWTVAHYKIPLLIIMNNNRSYYNDESHQEFIALQRKRPVENKGIGIRIEQPEVDFSVLAKSYGIVSLGRFESTKGLVDAVEEGARIVAKEGRACLIDTVMPAGVT
jgi:acetolactate synthase-1/2/3 large subunit